MKMYFLAVASGSQIKTVNVLKYPYVLINYATRTNNPRLPDARVVFGDCGGFYSSLKHNRYLTSDREYLEWARKTRVDFFALRDYPCEPELLRQHHTTAKENIHRTLENHLALLEMTDDIEAVPVPVLQGWNLEDYLYSIDLYKEHGLIMDYMAIGSTCRRGSQKVVERIITTVRDNLPSWVRLHGFGLSLNAIRRKAVWDSLYSADSGAWDMRARWKKLREGRPAREVSEEEAHKFIETIEKLQKIMKSQRTVYDFMEESK